MSCANVQCLIHELHDMEYSTNGSASCGSVPPTHDSRHEPFYKNNYNEPKSHTNIVQKQKQVLGS